MIDFIEIDFIKHIKTVYDDTKIYNVSFKIDDDFYIISLYRYKDEHYSDNISYKNNFYFIHEYIERIDCYDEEEEARWIGIFKNDFILLILEHFRFYFINN